MIKRTGVISTWLHARGFGFINSTENGVTTKLYCHISRIISGSQNVAVGAYCKFDVLSLVEGKSPSAIDVEIVDGGAK